MHALIIDLNNFSHYPTLSVGYLTAILKKNNIQVDVLSPLAKGVKGYPRLTRARPFAYYWDKFNYWSAVSQNRFISGMRKQAQKIIKPGSNEDTRIIINYTNEFLKQAPDIVLISAYTMYADTCKHIARLCSEQSIPVIIGGNYFIEPEIISKWTSIPGVTAVYGGEPEPVLINMVYDVVQGKDISNYPGVSVAHSQPRPPSPAIAELDTIPFPDYTDFPWELYPNNIIPIMTARGCGWGHCTFCSDIITSAGREYHSRSIDNVMDEITYQSSRFNSKSFVFLDLKLNSNLDLWRGLINRFPETITNANWTASVHIDNRKDNGLSLSDLLKAKKAGLSRITFGLESGSPRLLTLMAKGINLENVATFLKNAKTAGLSVRITCFTGYPGEQASDVLLTAQFLKKYGGYIERVVLNRFTIMAGTKIHERLKNNPQDYPSFHFDSIDSLSGMIPHYNTQMTMKNHRSAVYKLMKIVHNINRKPLLQSANEFEGVM